MKILLNFETVNKEIKKRHLPVPRGTNQID